MGNILKTGVNTDIEQQKELFLSTLLHDIKNPLLAQIAGLKFLKSEADNILNKEQKEILDLSLESSEHLSELLLSVLSIYKFENGVITLNKKYFEIDTLVEICIKEALLLARNKNVSVSFCGAKKSVYADEEQIKRVVENLLINAVSYCYENSSINVEIKVNDENIVLSFENYSPEIPKLTAENMFEKFVSSGDRYAKTSMGLGMYLSRKIIEAHGGRIWLEACAEKNKFIFTLPLNLQKIGRVIFD